MTKYTVTLRTYAFTYVDVEAEDPEAASEIAECADLPDLCAQCSGWGGDGKPALELNEVWEAVDATPKEGAER